MEKDWNHMSKKILDLTLEIIYLLTGEDHTVVKKTSGESLTPHSCHHRTSPITVPPPDCPTTEVTSAKKILEVTKKITELLTGKVPIRGQDVTVSLKGCLKGHKDVYKDDVMKDQLPFKSSDGSSNKNAPKRCPRSPCSLDSTKENITMPHHDQSEEMITMKVNIKEEEEEEEEEEDTDARDDQASVVIIKVEDSDLDIGTDGHYVQTTSEEHRTSCPDNNADESTDPDQSKPKEGVQTGESSCLACGKTFKTRPELLHHIKSHTNVTFTHSECGKPITQECALLSLERGHTCQRPFTCSQCGKSFSERSKLLIHQKIHTGERPYSCSECGKCFLRKAELRIHQRIHTGERPYSCSECGKRFSRKTDLLTHQRIHTGESPFSCSYCGKRFNVKTNLLAHQRIHTGERPFSCSECGKCFTRKTSLLKHQEKHKVEDSFSCSECGKQFTRQGNLIRHQRTHKC